MLTHCFFLLSVPFKEPPKFNPRRRVSSTASAASSSFSSPHPGKTLLTKTTST